MRPWPLATQRVGAFGTLETIAAEWATSDGSDTPFAVMEDRWYAVGAGTRVARMGGGARFQLGLRRSLAVIRGIISRTHPWLLLVAFALVGLAATLAGIRQAKLTEDKWSDDMWLEVAKAGVQIVAVGVFGGALTAVWHGVNMRREAKAHEDAQERELLAQRNDKLRAELAELINLYNQVKSVRRTLRSLGLDLKTYPAVEREAVRQQAVLTSRQARGFHRQMRRLCDLQLGFEAKARQFGQTDFLAGDTEDVVECLGRIEKHLNRVLEIWEHQARTIEVGAPLSPVSEGLVGLFRVGDHFRPHVAEPLREITRLINKHVFGEASKETRDMLASIFEDHDNRDQDAVETGST